MRERWRYSHIVNGYEVSDLGRVRCWWDGSESVVSPFVKPDGDLWVEVLEESHTYDYENRSFLRVPTEYRVWHLVIYTWFLRFSPPEMKITFLNGDTTDCSVENLGAYYRNSRGEIRMIGVREEFGMKIFDKRMRGKVLCVETGEVFAGAAEAALAIGGTKPGVSLVLSGRIATHRGFTFEYV